MKQTTAFATLAALAFSVVLADSSGNIIMSSSQDFSSAVGAAYFLTNEPSGNYVVSAAIGANGKLTLHQATPAEGVGSHGLPGNGVDALFSQGAVKANAAGRIVAAVNPGSNTISVFSIDPKNPTNLEMIGKPIGSGGEFPISVTINKAGNTVCTLNGGFVNGVACFSVNTKKGTITPIANTVRSLKLNQTTPANGPPGSASDIIFSEDNTKLIASVKGFPPTPGMLAVWNIANDGSLSQDFEPIQPAAGGLLPFSLTPIPGKNALLVADPGLGLDIFDLSTQSTNGLASGKSSTLSIPGQGATCWSVFSSKTGNAYVVDVGAALVTEISLDANLKPSIVKQYSQGNGTGPIDSDIATIGNKDFLYVLAANATAIKVMSLTAPGKATAFQTLDIAGPAKQARLPLQASNLQGMATYIKTT
ncbi:hypothetical protein C8F01DRAFT_1119751 [Mycena amicta]|nr:hypothetical protein C8F01DRAFT_1119751 [Mycena amicta]